ncbi:MAG TPA: hypothetical protein DFS52_07970, partial [Myxococcales bacterium]|nr:hypothetical protein [Myxococcales bacterium]
IVERCEKSGELLILLIGRPYHVDPLINHKITEMIADLGVSVITEDCLPLEQRSDLSKTGILTQWAYPNRMYDAAIWAGERRNVEVVQLNSFGCGPDAVSVDEVKAILGEYGKTHTLIRIDEITSPGSVRLRIRSLIESV